MSNNICKAFFIIILCNLSMKINSQDNMGERELIESLEQISLPEIYFDNYILEINYEDRYFNRYFGCIEYKDLLYISKEEQKRISIRLALYQTPEQAIEGLMWALNTRQRPYRGPHFYIGDYMESDSAECIIFTRANVLVDMVGIPYGSRISLISIGEEIDQKILEIVKR